MSKIAWTGTTWNPIVGCSKVSAGCRNCYAERMAFRLAHMGQANYQQVVDSAGWNGRVATCSARHWDNVPKSGLCFVCSMGDLFYEAVPCRYLDEVYSEMLSHPNTTFQVLTKRPQRALHYYESSIDNSGAYEGLLSRIGNAPNIWLGATCENQEWADRRLKVLYEIDPVLRFASLEPLLGRIDLKFHLGLAPNHEDLQGLLGWLIVGCESGSGRRPCKLQWVRAIVDQCGAAGVPVFVKQIEIDGRVVHDVEPIAKALGYTVAEIRQFPAGVVA